MRLDYTTSGGLCGRRDTDRNDSTVKAEQELKRARADLTINELSITVVEKQLEKLYAERRELINFLDANKGGCDGKDA